MEEGEIAASGDKRELEQSPRQWGPFERAAAALNLALYNALSGDGAAALAACESAVCIANAAGSEQVRKHGCRGVICGFA